MPVTRCGADAPWLLVVVVVHAMQWCRSLVCRVEEHSHALSTVMRLSLVVSSRGRVKLMWCRCLRRGAACCQLL